MSQLQAARSSMKSVLYLSNFYKIGAHIFVCQTRDAHYMS